MKQSSLVVAIALAFMSVTIVFGSLRNGPVSTKNRAEYTKNRYEYKKIQRTDAEIRENKRLKELKNVYGRMIHPDTSDKAIDEANRYLEDAIHNSGSTHQELADFMENVGKLYKYRGDFKTASTCFTKALSETRKDENHIFSSVIDLMDFQGEMACALGDFDEARKIYAKTLEFSKKTFGEASTYTFKRREHLRDFDESALPFLKTGNRAAPIENADSVLGERGENSLYGESSEYKLNCTANLVEYYLGQDRVMEAESVFLHSIKRIEAALGEGHPDVAWTYDFLFLLHNNQGDFEKADGFLRRSIAIRKELLDEERPFGFTTWDHKKLKKKVMGDYGCIMRNYLAALETRKKRVSPKAISLRLLYNTLGETCINLGHDSEAYRYFQKTAGILRLHDCQFITDEIPMLLFLARHDKSKRIQHSLNGIPRPLSLNYLKEVLKLAKAEIPADNMLLAETSYEIAEVYKGSGDYVSSEKLHQKALDLRLSVKQKDKLAIIQSLEALGRMHRDRKDYEKALLYFNRALIIKESLLKDDDVSLASSYMAIGKLECGVDRGIKGWFQSSKTNLKKAEELLKKAIVIYRRQGSDDVKELIEAYDSLKQVYLSTGRNSEADILSVEAKRALQQSSNSRQGF